MSLIATTLMRKQAPGNERGWCLLMPAKIINGWQWYFYLNKKKSILNYTLKISLIGTRLDSVKSLLLLLILSEIKGRTVTGRASNSRKSDCNIN